MVLDKNITKYINYHDPKYTWGQKAADGSWFCKEFKSDTIEEGKSDIIEINKMLNEVNIKKVKDEKRTGK